MYERTNSVKSDTVITLGDDSPYWQWEITQLHLHPIFAILSNSAQILFNSPTSHDSFLRLQATQTTFSAENTHKQDH
jgi:hypothetical protein